MHALEGAWRRGRVGLGGVGLATLAAVTAANGPLVAQDSAQAEEAEADTARVVVEGEVLDAATGVPVAGAIVIVPGLGTYTFSDELGYFRFDGVQPGVYFVRTVRIGYETLEADVPLLPNEMLVVHLTQGAIPLEGIEVTVIGPDELAWRTAGAQVGLIGPIEMTELSKRYLTLEQVFNGRRLSGARYIFSRRLGQPGCLRSSRGLDRLRPARPPSRGAMPGSSDCAAVVVDGVLLSAEAAGWVYELDPSDIFAVRFLHGTDAGARYGHTGGTGVLVVETKARR